MKKLSDSEVSELRKLLHNGSVNFKTLSKRFSVSFGTLSKIKNNKHPYYSPAHIPDYLKDLYKYNTEIFYRTQYPNDPYRAKLFAKQQIEEYGWNK